MNQRLKLVKTVLFPKLSYNFSQFLPKFQVLFFFYRKKQAFPKIHKETQKTQNNQSNPEKKDKSWNIKLLDFQPFCKTTVIKTV